MPSRPMRMQSEASNIDFAPPTCLVPAGHESTTSWPGLTVVVGAGAATGAPALAGGGGGGFACANAETLTAKTTTPIVFLKLMCRFLSSGALPRGAPLD